ncbi:hypothetical protein HY945_02095 [Candidatus Gottesmanbacteria bacterium]|nr:hypothetical protein [Candidatus Gottesmanbacteria bacterium]
MLLTSLGVLKLELGEASGTTLGEESTSVAGGETGEGVASVEGVDKVGSEGAASGIVETGSSTGGDDEIKESADGKVESAKLVDTGSMGAGTESSFAGTSADKSAGMFETGSGTGAELSIGRADMVESGSIGSAEIGSWGDGGAELTG